MGKVVLILALLAMVQFASNSIKIAENGEQAPANYLQPVLVLCGLVALFYIQYRFSSTRILEHWLSREEWDVTPWGKASREAIRKRFRENPEKRYGGLLESTHPLNGPYAEKNIGNHAVQCYVLAQVYLCYEITTVANLPKVAIARKSTNTPSKVRVETNELSDWYNINAAREAENLQLLDPHMLQLIQEAQPYAVEFSGKSIVVVFACFPLTNNKLDSTLQQSMAIADQADKNFPLGVYATQAQPAT
jgi:hypothetical protein